MRVGSLAVLISMLLLTMASAFLASVPVPPCQVVATPAIMMYPLWHFEIPSLTLSEYPSMQRLTVTRTVPNYNLSETDAFKSLRREPTYSGAMKELKDLQNLEDSRLASCEEKGIFWEQCFMYGQSNGERGSRKNERMISPSGSLNPSNENNKVMAPTW